MLNVEGTIISQYANATPIVSLVQGMNAHIDPRADIRGFYDDVFNIMTAKTWGLDTWGRILGIAREIEIEDDQDWFGFLGQELQPFDQGTFYQKGVTNLWPLSNEAYRKLLLLKAMANISDCSIPSINRLLNNFFAGRGAAYVIEIGVMRLRYVFEFYLEPYERSLMRREDIPPKPSGVGYEWLEIPPGETFGFAGSNLQPFNQGVFHGGSYVPYR